MVFKVFFPLLQKAFLLLSPFFTVFGVTLQERLGQTINIFRNSGRYWRMKFFSRQFRTKGAILADKALVYLFYVKGDASLSTLSWLQLCESQRLIQFRLERIEINTLRSFFHLFFVFTDHTPRDFFLLILAKEDFVEVNSVFTHSILQLFSAFIHTFLFCRFNLFCNICDISFFLINVSIYPCICMN